MTARARSYRLRPRVGRAGCQHRHRMRSTRAGMPPNTARSRAQLHARTRTCEPVGVLVGECDGVCLVGVTEGVGVLDTEPDADDVDEPELEGDDEPELDAVTDAEPEPCRRQQRR